MNQPNPGQRGNVWLIVLLVIGVLAEGGLLWKQHTNYADILQKAQLQTSEMSRQLNDANEHFRAQQTQQARLEEQLAAQTGARTRDDGDLQALREEFKTLSGSTTEIRADRDRLQGELAATKTQAEQWNGELGVLRQEYTQLDAKFQHLQHDLEITGQERAAKTLSLIHI